MRAGGFIQRDGAGDVYKRQGRTALIRSINTVAVQITQKLGTTTSYDFLKYSLNVDTLTAGDNSDSQMCIRDSA